MLEYASVLTRHFSTATFVEHLVTLGVWLGDQDSTVDNIAALKNELANEKQA
jgi:hypothetical protein